MYCTSINTNAKSLQVLFLPQLLDRILFFQTAFRQNYSANWLSCCSMSIPDPHFSSAFPSEVYKKRWEFVPLLMLDQTCSTVTSWKDRYHFQRHGQDEIGWEHKRKPPGLTNNPSHARSVPCLSSAFWILFSSSKYQSHVKCKPDLVLKTLNNSTFLSQEYHFCQGFEISVEGEEASSNVCSMVERAGTGSRLIHQRGCKLWTAMMLRYVQRVCHRSDRWWPWNFESDIEIIVEINLINLCAKLCSTYWRFAHPLVLPCIFPTKNHQDFLRPKTFWIFLWRRAKKPGHSVTEIEGFLKPPFPFPFPFLSIMHPGILSIKISPIIHDIHGFTGKWPKVFFWKVRILLEISSFFTEPGVWEEG